MRLAVICSTYKRPDGRTPFYLNRALTSIQNQTHKDFKVFLIGDAYPEKNELIDIISQFTFNIELFNLPNSIEREKYPFGDYKLFCSGGVTPALKGIEKALDSGYKFICHLDHDDYWEPNHLELINKVIEEKNPLFICTISTYFGYHLPFIDPLNEIQEYYPHPGGNCLSASCINYSDTLIRFRDVFAEVGETFPSDADFWSRLAEDMISRNKKGYIITLITCHHDEEGYSFRGDFKCQ